MAGSPFAGGCRKDGNGSKGCPNLHQHCKRVVVSIFKNVRGVVVSDCHGF